MKQKSLGVKARKRIGSVVYHCFMVLLSLTMIYPFVWSVLSSFKTSEQLYGGRWICCRSRQRFTIMSDCFRYCRSASLS